MAPTRSCAAWSRPASPAQAIHGNKSQSQRERVLAAFRKGDVKALVATDIAARGIDVDGISHVVNFDLPNVPETYVHRIGRTARAGADGIAISLCDAEEAGVAARHREADPQVHSGDRRPRTRPAGHEAPENCAPCPASGPTPRAGGGIAPGEAGTINTTAARRTIGRPTPANPRMKLAPSRSCSAAPDRGRQAQRAPRSGEYLRGT